MARRITTEDAVLGLKKLGFSCRASALANFLGTESRNVATALRTATEDGRVKISWPKGQSVAVYRFVRLSVARARK